MSVFATVTHVCDKLLLITLSLRTITLRQAFRQLLSLDLEYTLPSFVKFLLLCILVFFGVVVSQRYIPHIDLPTIDFY